MSVIILNVNVPVSCSFCEFGKRLDNGHTVCERRPYESPVEDGSPRPSFCQIKELVYCKDCYYSSLVKMPYGDYYCKNNEKYVSGDWFCADGERREE